MRRILATLLICLLPLQSFAGLVMSEKMISMEAQMADAPQAPCHGASQPMLAVDYDCYDSQTMCHSMCHIFAVTLPACVAFAKVRFSQIFLRIAATPFQSADLRLVVRPPIL